jgi:glycosyltransferase involved in cell wall biosynthesis
MEYREDIKDLPVYRKVGFNIFPFFRKFERIIFNVYADKLVKKYIKDFGKPDLIHCHGAIWAGDTSKQLKDKYGVPYVVTEHSSAVMRGSYSAEKKEILEGVYQQSLGLIAVSEKLKQAVKELGKKNVFVVPNVVDTSKFEKSKTRDPYKLININTLSKNKRVNDLIESFKLVRDKYNHAELHIVGDGLERSSLEALADKLGVAKSVVFHGAIPHHQINNLIEGKGILISTSEYETFGVTLIEAMAKGLPVVATKCGGPEDFVNEENGILVEVGDIDAISEAIIAMVGNYEQYSSDNIANFVQLNFGKQSIAKELEKIYLSVINS